MTKFILSVALRATVCLSVLCASSALAQSTTYIVDQFGGAGSNFTSISAAISAAQPGDVIVVRTGNYPAFVLDKGLTVLGEGTVTTSATIKNVPSGDVVAVARLELWGGVVQQCTGTVLLANSTMRWLDVTNASDVRCWRTAVTQDHGNSVGLDGHDAVTITNSRAEFSRCTLTGGDGFDDGPMCFGDGGQGGRGALIKSGSRVHFALSDVRGGEGGDSACGSAGYGGIAVEVRDNSEAIVAGTPNHFIRGGLGGTDGSGQMGQGLGLYIHYSATSANIRYSGCSISSLFGNGTFLHAVPDDPTLETVGDPLAGGNVQLVLHGVAGVNARLQQGNKPLVVDDGQTEIERLVNRLRLHPLGQIPTGGSVAYSMNVLASWPAGRLRLFQGQEVDAATGALIERTNSVFVIVH